MLFKIALVLLIAWLLGVSRALPNRRPRARAPPGRLVLFLLAGLKARDAAAARANRLSAQASHDHSVHPARC